MAKKAVRGKPTGDEDWGPPPPRSSDRGRAALSLAFIATAIHVCACTHLHAERPDRLNFIVTWEGPAAAWIEPLLFVSLPLIVFATALAFSALRRTGYRDLFALPTLVLIFLIVFGNCLFFAAMAES